MSATDKCLACGHDDDHATPYDDSYICFGCIDGPNVCTNKDRTIAALRAEVARLNVECEWTAEERGRLAAENGKLLRERDMAIAQIGPLAAEIERLKQDRATIMLTCANVSHLVGLYRTDYTPSILIGALAQRVTSQERHARIGAAVERLVSVGWISIIAAEPEWEIDWVVHVKGGLRMEQDALESALDAAVKGIGE